MSGNDPTQPPAPGDDQPTVPYPAADQQPTEAYPPVPQPYGAPPAAWPPAAPPQPYGAPPAYGAPQPPYGAPQPAAPDTRPRRLGWISLGLGVLGFVLVLVGFVPVLGIGLTFAVIGSLLLSAALVLAIVTLVSKRQGGTGLAIGAIVVSVIGGAVAVFALAWGLILFGLAAAGSSGGSSDTDPIPVPSVSQDTSEDTEAPSDGDASAAYDEAAYVALVRPQITALMQEVQPGITEDLIASIYSDEMLVATGKGFLIGGEVARAAFIDSIAQGDVMSPEQAERFVDILVDGAEQHLQ